MTLTKMQAHNAEDRDDDDRRDRLHRPTDIQVVLQRDARQSGRAQEGARQQEARHRGDVCSDAADQHDERSPAFVRCDPPRRSGQVTAAVDRKSVM